MWEYFITFEDINSAKHFKSDLDYHIKCCRGVISILERPNCYKVLIAIPIVDRFKIYRILKEKIAENILLFYKKAYILSKLEFNIDKSLQMQIFLKALVVFDSDTDKSIIVERLNFDSSIIISSFISFKLSFLKRKWDELVKLANDNSMYLLTKESFNELIKFLISNLEYRYCAVNIFSKQDCYLLCDKEGEIINDFLIDKHISYDDDNLLTSLIALNPEKIIIHCNKFVKDKLLSILYELFSTRIEIKKN